MNLINDPWIPVLRETGKRELLSLSQVFAEATTVRDLAVGPTERIALMRLLLCVANAALDGPADADAWDQCRARIQPAVARYLKKWRESFELFGDGARFLQISNLKAGREDGGTPATKLDLELASGNNTTLFDNEASAERVLGSGRLAMNLLTFQCFSPGGRIGVAKWNGNDTAGKGSSNHAPCCPSSMVHTLLIGENLLETIHLNLLTKETITDALGRDRWGKPIWEMPVLKNTDKDAMSNATSTYLGRLVPLSRAIWLNEDRKAVILANGLDYPIYPAFREGTATTIQRKDEPALLPASTERALWRQLGAIAVKKKADKDGQCGPLALSNFCGKLDATVWVGALVTDKAKIEDVVESIYCLPPGIFTEAGRAAYEKGVTYAEERETVLSQAVKAYASVLKADPAYKRARELFWTAVEQNLFSLFEVARQPDLVANLPASAWGGAVQGAVVYAFEGACPRQTPRQIEAFALGMRRINFEANRNPGANQ